MVGKKQNGAAQKGNAGEAASGERKRPERTHEKGRNAQKLGGRQREKSPGK